MSLETGRPIGSSPSTEFAQLSQSTASAPSIIITATIVTAATAGGLIHIADSQAQDVLYVWAFNNSSGTVTVYGQLGTTATTSSLPLSLSPKTSGLLFNALPISKGGIVGVWNDTASSGVVVVGSVQRTYI